MRRVLWKLLAIRTKRILPDKRMANWWNYQVSILTVIRMNMQTQARYVARAKVIKALAHPTRLFIVDELSRHGEKCVCQLTEMIGADMSTVSRHLSVLKAAGLVEDERQGAQILYRVRVSQALRFLECIETLAQAKAGLQPTLAIPHNPAA